VSVFGAKRAGGGDQSEAVLAASKSTKISLEKLLSLRRLKILCHITELLQKSQCQGPLFQAG
jgi:hypothetical protein